MEIREIPIDQRESGLRLAWNTFLAYAAPAYLQEGITAFWDYLHTKESMAALEMWGAYEEDRLVGILATREQRGHIALFFVAGDRLGQGIGKALFQQVVSCCPGPRLTVHSSPYAVPVYQRLGFTVDGPERQEDGIRYTPMTYRIRE